MHFSVGAHKRVGVLYIAQEKF